MTCENCIHKDLCYENCELNYDKDDLTCHYCKLITCPEHLECKFFKDKTKFVELPCKVGAEIFILMIDDEFPNYVDLGTVEGLSYQADGVWIFARYECGLTYWHPLNELGKEFFFDPYEAEKALKERERNE